MFPRNWPLEGIRRQPKGLAEWPIHDRVLPFPMISRRQKPAQSGSSSPGGAGRAQKKPLVEGLISSWSRSEATLIVCDSFDWVVCTRTQTCIGRWRRIVPNERDPSEKTLQCRPQLTVHAANGTSYRPSIGPVSNFRQRFEKCVEFTRAWRRGSGLGRANREARPAISLRAGARHQTAADSGGYRETPSH